jgi:hypothetical protein
LFSPIKLLLKFYRQSEEVKEGKEVNDKVENFFNLFDFVVFSSSSEKRGRMFKHRGHEVWQIGPEKKLGKYYLKTTKSLKLWPAISHQYFFLFSTSFYFAVKNSE